MESIYLQTSSTEIMGMGFFIWRGRAYVFHTCQGRSESFCALAADFFSDESPELLPSSGALHSEHIVQSFFLGPRPRSYKKVTRRGPKGNHWSIPRIAMATIGFGSHPNTLVL